MIPEKYVPPNRDSIMLPQPLTGILRKTEGAPGVQTERKSTISNAERIPNF